MSLFDMRIRLTPETEASAAKAVADEKRLFTAGKLRIGWSQMRGGFAIFISGRMEGQLFDSEADAKEYLDETHGIKI